jgi:predicted RNase H-like nuclease
MTTPIHIDITTDQLHAVAERLRDVDAFALEPPAAPGRLADAVIDELCALRASAKAAAETFAEAITEQAEKANLKKGALRRYINARVADRLAELDAEADDLAKLMLREEN